MKISHQLVPYLAKPVSRLVLGTSFQGGDAPESYAFDLFDSFFERGGNCFDTAHLYGGGVGERLLGQWMRERGVREEAVVIAKGAHTPHCNPESMAAQLGETLERLQTDHADLYFLHRDNPDVPVGEFVEALNEEVRAGRLRTFGGSNWSLERFAEANAYADQKGLQGFSILSNQFSLARMVSVWEGCVSSSDAASQNWLAETQTPLFAWSSQARSFFVRGSRDYTASPDLNYGWYSDDNFERLARAQELAGEKGCEPIQIALAYVLHQPFPTFALVGAQAPSRLESPFRALDLRLSVEELAWLNLEFPER